MNKRPVAIIILTMSVFTFLSSCHVGKYFYRNVADTGDHKRFPAYTVKAAPPVFNFAKALDEQPPILPEAYNPKGKYSDFTDYLEENKSLSFLVIRNDSILYERYFDGYDRSTITAGFSVAKVFVSALTGIAVQEGYIESVDQTVSDFLPEMKDPGFKDVTIENLLNMRSGIKFSESYVNPFGHTAKFYYGNNLSKYVHKLKVNKTPGEEYYYQSANTEILAMIIEKTTGKPFTVYFEEKIWSRLGLEYDATWNYDSEKHGLVKAFCCLNACPEDFAKFGRLYLNNGIWEGRQIVPEAWVKHSMSIHNNSRDSQNYSYSYFWRVLESGSVFGKGILGQYIYVNPTRNLIIVKFGKKNADINWPELFEEIAKQY
jgi:CubicO group peptidase (beta-lactamase class C family)